MAVRKIRKSWWVDFQFDQVRYRRRSPENTRQGALTYELLMRRKLASGELANDRRPQRRDDTFAEFAKIWFEDYVRTNNKYSEQLAKKYVLSASLVPFFGSKPVEQISAHDIERYKTQQVQEGFTNKTIVNRLTVLNKCLVTAYEWLELQGAPPKIKWPKWLAPEIDYLSPEECQVLVSHANGVIQEMALMALRTGMRQGELRGLQWSSVDWLTRSVVVRHSRDDYQKILVSPKSNRARHIPLDVDIYAMLYQRKKDNGYVFLPVDGRPFTNDRASAAMRKLCKQAGLRKIGWHTLRHTFASHLAMRGVPLPVIKELMGHATITTTMRYAHVAPSTLRAAIEMLNPKTMIATDSGQPAVNQWQALQRGDVGQKTRAQKYR
jgi:integrase